MKKNYVDKSYMNTFQYTIQVWIFSTLGFTKTEKLQFNNFFIISTDLLIRIKMSKYKV